MNKTAMQRAIQYFDSLNRDEIPVTEIIAILKSELPTERQQIEDAYERGGYDEGEGIDIFPANYYDSTYKTS